MTRSIINPARGRIAATIGGISIAEALAAYRLANLVKTGQPPDPNLLNNVTPDRRNLVTGCSAALLPRNLWPPLLATAPSLAAAEEHAEYIAAHLRHTPTHAR